VAAEWVGQTHPLIIGGAAVNSNFFWFWLRTRE
jgi:hypothetical protein